MAAHAWVEISVLELAPVTCDECSERVEAQGGLPVLATHVLEVSCWHGPGGHACIAQLRLCLGCLPAAEKHFRELEAASMKEEPPEGETDALNGEESTQ